MDRGVIRRKLAGGGGNPTAVLGTGAEKHWPLALARAARDMFGLALDLEEVRGRRISLAELLEVAPDRAMICLLEGPKGGLGVLMLAPEVLAGLIEAQTLGRVSDQPVTPRKPTRTDAAMVAEFLDSTMAGLEEALLTDEDLTWTDGFRYAGWLDELRPLGLMLEDAPFKTLTGRMQLGGGQKSGVAVLALPAEGHGRRPHRVQQLTAVREPAADMVFKAAIAEQIMAADAVLRAVLSRVTLPLAEVMGLKAGDVLPLPNAAIDRLEVQGLDGRRVATAKLGQQRGMRAIRLQVGAGGGGIDAAATVAIGATVTQNPAVSGHANQPPAVAGDSSGLARTGT